ncbi:MAG: acetyl-CoA carboxylase biotin carboxylase subunit [Candidatus Omnitrophica bacterium]|nr:acetyl-CoA carboxylase biotin carboxylase subunit [Candidatus Omnitrophota bacterium]MBU1133460.1 acetyl-CoA carboxylase biotin carboxylase subunit [Candidatus Omnitrophota bacterium]MBU1366851.1 acetyl-CoA carboxylase biotin carboxylase subunit [Candidatus Omnitrophota bacterium]MBU1524182.1 acetyl-CoA carboxylase biotin carboxylase subunit [Candidatus Omnitrophota bacterium]MBU1810488.1 acetyl-CoA carboxylase biotin carboxylase subunit [Candidatus Omnitrophota bacterium]
MFSKILIANRGEIALRIIRACKEMGIKTVAVYSEADKDSLHVRFADEAVCIGKPQSKESYLNIPAIISAAEITDVEAIHPGYGFLSENTHFVEICESCKITFIGPPPEAIAKMGDKSVARETMKKARIPVVPGSEGVIKDEKEVIKVAEKIGYPVMIKASAGGGGKGMRIAHNRESLISGFHMAKNEAQAAFGNNEVYIEKYIDEARHIEVQVLADKSGNTIHVRERECSIQRRHQKLIEETPSPAINEKLRDKMGKIAIKAAKAVNYFSTGTVEFILDKEGNFYFMEMNTRIQVEHPITEMITGVDLVKEQIRIAAGQRLAYQQQDISCNSHSIECRINAEDPDNNFMPSPGKVTFYSPLGGIGVRVDSHLYAGYSIPPYYDSLIAKLIVHADDRKQAIARMRRALGEFIIEGIKTTIPFHLKVLNHGDFQRGEYSTKFIEKKLMKDVI